MSQEQIMPAIFVGHGSPQNAMNENEFTQSWRDISNDFPKPKAILAISAHWQTEGTQITASEWPETVHDFYNFPKPMYEVQYNAPGSLWLVDRVQQLLGNKIIKTKDWGLDHGTWSVLRKMYPQADVPVVQLSLDLNQDYENHIILGQKLQQLRQEGVLILGSGNIVHNTKMYFKRLNSPDSLDILAGDRFDAYVRQQIESDNAKGLSHYLDLGMDAKLSVPTDDHYLPILYVFGSKFKGEKTRYFSNKGNLPFLSMTSLLISDVY